MKQPKTESIWTRFLRVLASFASDQGRDRATVGDMRSQVWLESF